MKLTKKNSPALLHPYLEEINSLYRVYVRVMDLKRARKDSGGMWRVKAWAYVLYGYVRDIVFNLTTASRIFNDSAQELTFTARLTRYRNGEDREKKAIAEWFCDTVLDKVDPSGDHC